MANICLNSKACQSNGITLGEALLLIAIHNAVDFKQAEDSLIQKGFITATRDNLFRQNGWRLTRMGGEVIDNVILASDTSIERDELEPLAIRLKALFPKGKKAGTSTQWTEGVELIIKRLKLFFRKYPRIRETYTDDDIVETTQHYVQSFNGDYTLMRVLKYFIFKEIRNANNEVESSSDLISRLEDTEEDVSGSDWRDSVR